MDGLLPGGYDPRAYIPQKPNQQNREAPQVPDLSQARPDTATSAKSRSGAPPVASPGSAMLSSK